MASSPAGADPTPSKPRRTCVGCRTVEPQSDLLRVVAVAGVLTPDPRGRLPGRGAYLHPRPECLSLAFRRKAFPRALRTSAPLDSADLMAWVAAQGH